MPAKVVRILCSLYYPLKKKKEIGRFLISQFRGKLRTSTDNIIWKNTLGIPSVNETTSWNELFETNQSFQRWKSSIYYLSLYKTNYCKAQKSEKINSGIPKTEVRWDHCLLSDQVVDGPSSELCFLSIDGVDRADGVDKSSSRPRKQQSHWRQGLNWNLPLHHLRN